MFPITHPLSIDRMTASFKNSAEFLFSFSEIVFGNNVPKSGAPIAERIASVTACITASPSLCAIGPTEESNKTPPMTIFLPPSAGVPNRCRSYPCPTLISI